MSISHINNYHVPNGYATTRRCHAWRLAALVGTVGSFVLGKLISDKVINSLMSRVSMGIGSVAALYCFIRLMDFLLIDWCCTPNYCGSPLLKNVCDGNIQRVKNLLYFGANPNARLFDDGAYNRSNEYDVPLFHVRDLETAQVLLEAGADPNAQGCDGTVLHYAVQHVVDPKIIELLILRRAKKATKNVDGETPLDIAKNYDTYADRHVYTLFDGKNFINPERIPLTQLQQDRLNQIITLLS